MHVTLTEYRQFFRRDFNFFFGDCAVRSRRIFVFVVEPELTDAQVEEEEQGGYDPSLRRKGIYTLIRDAEAGKRWSGKYQYGWQAIITGAATQPVNQSVNVERFTVFPSMEHRVYVTGSGPAYEDSVITSLSEDQAARQRGQFTRGAINRLKPVDGFLYACGGGRTIAKRLGKGEWQSMTQDIPAAGDEGMNVGDAGFRDLDSFGESDIYAVGGHGDVWHFDGQAWRRVAFPSNEVLNSVCCGGDGNVYISGYEGVTWMGRGDTWQKIHRGGISQGFRDMVWYEDKVWCTSDYGLWTIENGKVSTADVPPDVSACSGHLSVGDGVLLLAGLYGAVFREAGQWETIVLFSSMAALSALDEGET